MKPPFEINRPLVVLDVETTGTDIVNDAIWNFAAVRYWPTQPAVSLSLMIWPWKPIPDEVCDLCNITNEMLASKPPFKFYANKIRDFLVGCDYAGFNCRGFDLPIAQEELLRAGIRWNPLEQGVIIDAGIIFKKKEERTLTAALKFYCGRDHVGAHEGALTDVKATSDVLSGQMAKYPDLAAMNLQDLAVFSQYEEKLADLAGKLMVDTEGDICYAFGQHDGKKVRTNPGYAEWMLSKDFPASTKDVLRKTLELL